MENFIVSARKYRPVTFDTVVGQTSITSTLKNAINNHHLAQAFLFCGPRGVGKTTCARILAKTINCENLSPNTEACNECKPCLSFNTSNSFNVFELDAASNNSVDDIRNLVDQVRIPPQVGEYKVYIIDEVHMLSPAAFNAFLKTLEEPPPYAKFILATTEKHKIIPTILSRCQIFDFKRITIDDIAKHLAFVAKNENVIADPNALHIIAQKADGALRDALSIFDQIVSFVGDAGITYDAVLANLNVLDYDYFFEVTKNLLKGNMPKTLLILNEILDRGFDGHHFISGLGEHFRSLLVCKDASTIKLLEVGENILIKYGEQSKICTPEFLLRSLDIVAKCDVNYKTANSKRLLLELALMQMCSISSGNIFFNDISVTETLNPVIPAAAPVISTSQPAGKKGEAPVKVIATAEPKKAEQITDEVKKEETLSAEAKNEKVPLTEEKNEEAKIGEKKNNETEIPTISDTPLKPAVKRIITGTPSIRENLEKKDIDKSNDETVKVVEAETDYKKPASEFSKEQFEKAWTDFAMQFKQESPAVYITLTANMPVIKDSIVIELTIDNVVQEKDINDRKFDILAYLRKELNNYEIQLQTVINKNPDNVKPFTPQEKFKKMAEKNPNIKKLKDKFDLELDF